MQVYGVDLSRWWQQRRWKSLLELIDELPAASRFNEAILNDREFAKEAVAQETADRPEWAPKISEFDLHAVLDRKSTRLNSSHVAISYAVFCLKKKNK